MNEAKKIVDVPYKLVYDPKTDSTVKVFDVDLKTDDGKTIYKLKF